MDAHTNISSGAPKTGVLSGVPKIGVMLVNTGSPSAPTPEAVAEYLGEFLNDERIRPMNKVAWNIILRLFILPKRSGASSEKYKRIWTENGSPLIVYQQNLAAALQADLNRKGIDALVCSAMNYGEPSIESQLARLREAGCARIAFLPLYPQAAFSTFEASKGALDKAVAAGGFADISIESIRGYHDNAAYIKALAHQALNSGFDPDSDDHLLISYHSVPMQDIDAGDTYDTTTSDTAVLLADALGISRDRWSISYQCRFDKGRDWLQPYVKPVLEQLAHSVPGRLFMICPNFAIDCLETLYDVFCELKPLYQDARKEANGRCDDFVYIPCLNDSIEHADVLASVLQANGIASCHCAAVSKDS